MWIDTSEKHWRIETQSSIKHCCKRRKALRYRCPCLQVLSGSKVGSIDVLAAPCNTLHRQFLLVPMNSFTTLLFNTGFAYKANCIWLYLMGTLLAGKEPSAIFTNVTLIMLAEYSSVKGSKLFGQVSFSSFMKSLDRGGYDQVRTEQDGLWVSPDLLELRDNCSVLARNIFQPNEQVGAQLI